MIIILIFITVIVIYIEVPTLIKNKYWKELTIFSIILSTGFVFLLLLIIGVKIPSPALFIEDMITNLFM